MDNVNESHLQYIEIKLVHIFLSSGAGASCIYPLLGCKQNGWSFLASEVDDQNLVFAKKNIQQNNMGDKITGIC